MSRGNGGRAGYQQMFGGQPASFADYAGMRSPGFSAPRAATASTALPASLANLINQQGQAAAPGVGTGGGSFGGINLQALQMQPTGTVASNPNYPVLDFRMQPTYADGGQVGPDGTPMMGMQGGMGGGEQIPAEQLEAMIEQTLQQNPQIVQQMQQVITQALQSGELTMEQLNMAVQLARAAAQNPQLYPRLRQLAIQRGLAGPDELPEQYDQGIVAAILIAGAAAQSMGGGMPMQQPPQQMLANGGRVDTFNDYFRPGFQGGGDIPEEWSPTKDKTGRADDISIRVSGGEYVIPKRVVEAKGTEFFDKLLKQYDDDAKGTA